MGWIFCVLPVSSWNAFHTKMGDYFTMMQCKREGTCPIKAVGWELIVAAVFFSLCSLLSHVAEFKHVMKQHEQQKAVAQRMILKAEQEKLNVDVSNARQTRSNTDMQEATQMSNQTAEFSMENQMRKVALESEQMARDKQQRDMERVMKESQSEYVSSGGGFRVMV